MRKERGILICFSIILLILTTSLVGAETPLYSFADISDLHICHVDQIVAYNGNTDPGAGGISCGGSSSQGITGTGGIVDLVNKINGHSPAVSKTIITGDLTNYGSLLAYNNGVYFNSRYTENANTQFMYAKSYLDSLGGGYYVIPGNHDTFGGSAWSPNDYALYFKTYFGLSGDSYIVNVGSLYQFVFLTCMGSQGGNYGAYCSSSELTMLQNALSNGRKTIVFAHFPILQEFSLPHEASPYSNKEALASILNSPNLALIVVGHDGCSQGTYTDNTPQTYIRQYMAPHKYCGGKDWCGDTCRFSPSEAVPTIAYFDLYSDKIIINQQCTTSGCVNPATITIPILFPTCSFSYSSWTECSISGTQTRTELSRTPVGCTGTPILTQTCSYISNPPPVPSIPNCTILNWISNVSPIDCPSLGRQIRTWTKIGICQEGVQKTTETISCNFSIPTCTDFNYSDWTNCSDSEIQTRSILNTIPVNCQNGNPQLTRECEYDAHNPNGLDGREIQNQTRNNSDNTGDFIPVNLIPNHARNPVALFFTRIWCKFMHLFDSQEYAVCISR